MKKNTLGAAVLAAILASGALNTCSGNPKKTATAVTGAQAANSKAGGAMTAEAETMQANAELKEVVVGVSLVSYAEILNTARKVLTLEGYELRIVEYTGYAQPNNALDSGDLDADCFQHEPYLDSLNERDGTNLVSAGAIHYKPFGIHTGRTTSLEEPPDKVAIPVPNDMSNEVRALLLLETQGLTELKDSVDPGATKSDIAKNTENLDTIELGAAQFLCSISDSDTVIISSNYVIEAGPEINDALATEDSQSLAAVTYDNVVAVRKEEGSSDTTKALVEALASPGIKRFMEETCEGAMVPLLQHIFADNFQLNSFKMKYSYS